MIAVFKAYMLVVMGLVMWASSASAGSGCPIHAMRAAFASPVTTLRSSLPDTVPSFSAFRGTTTAASPSAAAAPASAVVARALPTHARAATRMMAATVDEVGAPAQRADTSKTLMPHAVGVSIHHADVSVREKLAAPEKEWNEVAAQLVAESDGAIEEAAVLSTCNRFEVYFSARDERAGLFAVTAFLQRRSELPMRFLRESLFMLSGDDAAWHLLRVSAGLDSLVVGEGQILAQVRQCYLHASDPGADGETLADGADEPEPFRAAGSGGKVLARLLNVALAAGKRVRDETDISKGAVSISSAAYEFSDQRAEPDLSMDYHDAKVAIVGAGTMTRLLLTHMASHGVEQCDLVSRSRAPAEALAEGYDNVDIRVSATAEDGDAAMWDAIAKSDIVYTSTSSPNVIVDAENLERELGARGRDMKARPLMFVDISLPRNVDDDALNALPGSGVVAYNVDNLKAVVARNTAKRRKEMLEAEALLREELSEFDAWLAALGAVPAISELQSKAEAYRLAEYKKANKKLKNLSDKEMDAVNRLSRGIVNKLLHGPLSHLRSSTSLDGGADNLATVKDMYGLDK